MEGRHILDWHPQGYLKPGIKGQPNKCAMLHACLVRKYKNEPHKER
jgi:hypothetical protein